MSSNQYNQSLCGDKIVKGRFILAQRFYILVRCHFILKQDPDVQKQDGKGVLLRGHGPRFCSVQSRAVQKGRFT